MSAKDMSLPKFRRLLPGLLLLLLSVAVAPAARADEGFAAWLAVFKQEAVADGIRPQTVEAAFEGVQPIPHVIELDHRQPEVTLTFDDYIDHILSAGRIAEGQRQLAANRPLLDEISRRYGVPAPMIVALWGIETNYGRITGNYPVVAALATLAYDGRRGAFFRNELIAALRILDRGRIAPDQLRGSWAGAMGQTQFMPSSYLRFAVDYSGTGEADIWADRADVFASIANYLASSGWTPGLPWGKTVRLPPGFDETLVANLRPTGQKPLDDWRILGIQSADGTALLPNAATGSLVQPGGPGGPTLLVTGNYRVILKWNRSLYFASAAAYLADRIGN
jgi:membrane-bound lytic murein transglycosylase B